MKKYLSVIIIVFVLSALLSGCGSGGPVPDGASSSEAGISDDSDGSEGSEGVDSEDSEEVGSEDSEEVNSGGSEDMNFDDAEGWDSDGSENADSDPVYDSEEEGLEIPDGVPVKPQGHYVFQPKVCSVYMEELFGRTMCETWYNVVDAVMAGEDTFACPDQHTYGWVMGQFPDRCFPVLTELIERTWDGGNSVVDGRAGFTYLVPREEAARRIAEFATQIEEILNDALEDDYSDLEKALALYNYFARHYVYDYETFESMKESAPDLRCIHVFNTGTGVCQEISFAYSYLLMQAGVDATVMSGHRTYDNSAHQWSYVRINGHNYHIDPTYVLNNMDSLYYFMMTDGQRFRADSYDPSTFIVTSNYSQDYPHPDYVADDETFSPIWNYMLYSFIPEENKLVCYREDDNGEMDTIEFDYSGF